MRMQASYRKDVRGTEKGKKDVIAEMASVTYKRLEAAMEEAGNAIEDEAWELVAALIRLLNQESGIPQEKRLEYAKGIRDFSQEMYLEKIARFRGEKQYSHCRELVEYWMTGKKMVESLEGTRQPMGTRLVHRAGRPFTENEYKD